MAPSKWDDEEEDSTPPSSPQVAPVVRRKFEDEEDDADVLDSWDAAADSEEEREKAKKAAEVKAQAEAEAKANKKSKAQRIEERRVENMRRKLEDEEDSETESEDEAEKRARLRRVEKDADLKNAEDLFGDVGISNNRAAAAPVIIKNPENPNSTIELSSLKLFQPATRDQFFQLRETLAPLISSNSTKAQYTTFMTEFVKQICKDMPSDQVKKVATGLTTLSNEKLKEEKAADKGGKKSKAAKSKVTLNATRDTGMRADTTAYDDGLEDDDFM